MNVTLKLPDELVRNARHLAVVENTSLSAIVTELLRLKLKASAQSKDTPQSGIDAFSSDPDDAFLDRDFPLEDRKAIPNREFSFAPDDE